MIAPSVIAQFEKIILLVVALVAMVALSIRYPDFVAVIPLLGFGVGISIWAIPVLVMLILIFGALYNRRYVLCDDYVLEARGRVWVKLFTTRIQYVHIKTLEVNKGILGRIFDYGDIILTTGLNDSSHESCIEMQGIANPHQIKDLIHAKMVEKESALVASVE